MQNQADGRSLAGVDIQEAERFFKFYAPLFLFIQKKTKGGYQIEDGMSGETIDGTFYIRDEAPVCRFCGRASPTVTFRKKAHLFPESIGNKLFVSKNECDSCNQLFSRYETDLITFLKPYFAFNPIRGKNGLRKYRSNDKTSTIEQTDEMIKIQGISGKEKMHLDLEKNELRYDMDIGAHSKYNIYSVLVKMALSILPENLFGNFTITRDCLMKRTLLGHEYFISTFFPGINRFELTAIGFLKKVADPRIPTYQFAIMNGSFMLQVPLFSNQDLMALDGKTFQIEPFIIPTPFDRHETFGCKKSEVIVIQDDSVTPAGQTTITMKFDDATRSV